MSSGDKHSKTEKPTPKKLREARKEGRIARSPELLAWTSVLAASWLLRAVVKTGVSSWRAVTRDEARLLSHPDTGPALSFFGTTLRRGAVTVAPLLLGLMAIGVLGNFAQVRFAFTTKPLKPKLTKLNPLKGIKRLVSPQSGWEAVKSLLKLALVSGVGWQSLSGLMHHLNTGGARPVTVVAGMVGSASLSALRSVSLAGLLLAAVDYLLQRRRIGTSLKMTKQQVKDEHRQSEGSPEIKGAIRRKQLSMTRMRMMAAVAGADAVVVNPTHYSVAVAYRPGRGAPRVVAKGAGPLALRIRAEAEDHGVPIVADVPLARALYAACELDQEIPADLFEAVARLLTFLYTLRAAGRLRPLGGGAHRPPAPLLTGEAAQRALEALPA